MFLGGQLHTHPKGVGPTSLNFGGPLSMSIQYDTHAATKFCVMIKADERKILVGLALATEVFV